MSDPNRCVWTGEPRWQAAPAAVWTSTASSLKGEGFARMSPEQFKRFIGRGSNSADMVLLSSDDSDTIYIGGGQ